jgi:hypothetical protein
MTLAVALLALAVACAGSTTAAPTPSATAIPIVLLAPTNTVPPSATPLPTATATVTAIPSATFFTHTPPPSWTPLPSMTPTLTPSATPTSIATKQVLLQLANSIGDGGGLFGRPFELIYPSVVLYTDGEILVPDPNDWFLETKLSTTQMCSLLHQIADTGFFKVQGTGALGPNDPIYSFTATPETIEGAPAQAIQVNGSPAKIVDIYDPYKRDVIGPIKAVLRLLNNYRPAGLMPYRPTRMLMVLDSGRDMFNQLQPHHDDQPTVTPPVQTWPSNLPPLADLWGGQPNHQVFIQGELIEPLLNLKLPKHYGVFTDRGQEYSIIMRPMLPHETLDASYHEYPSGAKQFDLPFQCAK